MTTKKRIAQFQADVLGYYQAHKRRMSWRDNPSFYNVLVSELMLQQTQVSRVMPKFTAFMTRFPDIESLAAAPLADVLVAWQGLGYNRRAKFLHQAAGIIKQTGAPASLAELIKLPGVGKNTAGAIMAYAYNEPVVFVETNIRTVFIHEFFADKTSVDDEEIRALVTLSLDRENPRQWYYALMDYGTYLKSQSLGSIRKSRHYVKQSTFEGSLRQARGQIIKALTAGPHDTASLARTIGDHYSAAVAGLAADGLIEIHDDIICLTAHTQAS